MDGLAQFGLYGCAISLFLIFTGITPLVIIGIIGAVVTAAVLVAVVASS